MSSSDSDNDNYDSDNSSDSESELSENATIIVYSKTKFWLYKLQDTQWDHLLSLFNKKKFYVSSFKDYKIKQNDVIIIYHKSNNFKKCGFVAICQTLTDMKHNSNGIKIFIDTNMNKFYCELSIASTFNVPQRISQIENHLKLNCKSFSLTTFKSKYISSEYAFCNIPEDIGSELINVLSQENNLQSEKKEDNFKKKIESDSDSKLESELESENSFENSSDSSEDDSKSYIDQSESSSDESNDDILVVKGHIPIMMIPCADFVWDSDSEISLKNFKKHYNTCSICEKTDNNNISLTQILENAEIYCRELKNEERLEEYLEHYYELRNYKFEVIDEDKKYNHVYIYRINQRGHIYHKCILIIW